MFAVRGIYYLPQKVLVEKRGDTIENLSLFTPEDLGVTLAIPTLSDRPRRQRRKKTNRDITNDPFPPCEELNIPVAIPLDDPSVEMTLQRSWVTLA